MKNYKIFLGFLLFFSLAFVNSYNQERIKNPRFNKVFIASGVVTDKFINNSNYYLTIDSKSISVNSSVFNSTNINENVSLSTYERIFTRYDLCYLQSY